MLREICLQKELSECPHVVKIEKVLYNEKYIIMVMEYCDGDLADYMRSKDTGLKEDDARHMIKQLMEAMMYLHRRNIVHRDLKLDNILLKK